MNMPDQFDDRGRRGYDGYMESRMDKLEKFAEKTTETLHVLATDVAVIKSNYVTKADLQTLRGDVNSLEAKMLREINRQTWRLMIFVTTFVTTFCSALVGVVYYIARYVH